MIISNANISLQQSHEKITRSEERESLNFWIGDRPQALTQPTVMPERQLLDNVDISPQASHAPHREQHDLKEMMMNAKHQLMVQIISQMVEQLTGKKFELFDPAILNEDIADIDLDAVQQSAANGGQAPQSAGFGLEYDYYASHYEYESLSFSAEGVIQTQDGRTINFSAQLNIEREYFEEQSFSFRAGDAVKIDPLVLNFNGTAAELQQTHFEFDLDANGQTEQVALLKPGNAYLALDKNNDGTINDGSELFGPSTGNGFNELANYDEDGNNFIDEADSIYDHLRLWTIDANGHEQLIGLGEKGVGAIYLGHLNTPFELQHNQQSLGDLVSSSVYLKEDGGTGFIQQLDYRV
ncbi:hypothetical protein A9Q79_08235 [Methylophaga sp. 42_25_T18]|nr:hypothetical protein A9Q79_08235 [Methylophaga sp. 42_25_T18]